MKKILLYILLLTNAAACTQDDLEPAERPDERLTTVLNDYQQKLAGAENGWDGYLFPQGGGGATFHFQFSNNNRVTSYADINTNTASNALESSYRLKATQLPSLYFDTYTYLHMLADPDPDVLGGAEGAGFSSDFEFSILSASDDTIKLKGNLNNSNLILVRAKDANASGHVAQALATNAALRKTSEFTYYYNILTLGGKQYQITLNPDVQTISFYTNNNGFSRFSTAYAASATGLILKDSFVDGDIRVTELHDININEAQDRITLTAGTTTGTTTNAATPLAIDPDAATRMYTAGNYYFSDSGFTMAGRTDAQNVSSLPGFQGMVYYPGYGSGYDALLFLYEKDNQSQVYGPAFLTRLGTDGKMTFYGYAGNFGTSPGEPHLTTLASVRTQFLSTSGYYVYQTGESSYDLVSAANSRNWIRFR